ncbi:LysR family transcriptional regulator [Rhodovastum atsumiense]|uniref:LysR family transcriptional regulator n=1 Tax=Rhodovastum atsumiense TaxID=504468 RepID=A0A5M6IPV8_9PROT|nr:LysR family transcriptional regulator [Rhodovastum atsumiense]KAA5609939.1 LysR family transcriptional regulator [Rhodovastum atsumiense]CAH2604560.1 LysR family transcriptional regulator [Rhodovastum atsumiense]
MDWDHLRIFLAVARSGQMLAAAARLGLNHATVARRLDALEDSLGVRLFDRRPAGSVLTQAGEQLLPTAERIETEILGIIETSHEKASSVTGTVRIGAPDGLGNYFLAVELGKFTRLHPGLVVELVPLPRTFSLSRREADLAICLDPPTEGRLLVTRLSDYSLSVYAAGSYLAANGTPIAPDDLADHVIVTGVEDYAYASSLDYAMALERHARRLFRCASVVGQMEAVKAGVGIGILHDFAARGSAGLVPILPQLRFRRSYHLLAHPDTQALLRVASCRAFLARRFKEERLRFLPD